MYFCTRFRPKNGVVEKVSSVGGGARTLKRMKQEIACVTLPALEPAVDTERVKGRKRTILTMKSLILAQDER